MRPRNDMSLLEGAYNEEVAECTERRTAPARMGTGDDTRASKCERYGGIIGTLHHLRTLPVSTFVDA